MPEQKSADKPKAAGKRLGRAAESSDPAVHQLLADRQTAVANDDKQALEDVDRRLADLGYQATE